MPKANAQNQTRLHKFHRYSQFQANLPDIKILKISFPEDFELLHEFPDTVTGLFILSQVRALRTMSGRTA